MLTLEKANLLSGHHLQNRNVLKKTVGHTFETPTLRNSLLFQRNLPFARYLKLTRTLPQQK